MKSRTSLRLAALLYLGVCIPVTAGTISGRVLDAEGNPVPGARVYWTASRTEEEALADDTAGVDQKAAGETRTAADGTFRATLAAQPGAVAVRVEAAGLPGAVLPGPYDAADATTLPEIELPAAEKLAGKVVDESGKPVAGARVRVSSRGLLDADVGLFASAVSGADGGFTIPNAPKGLRSLEVRAAGFAPSVRPLLEATGNERVVLKAGGTVSGTVLEVSGKAAANAIVSCESVAARTGSDGKYRLTGVPAGTRAVEALGDDEAIRKDGVKVAAGSVVELPLKLAKAATIGGTVVDETTRKPVAGVRIAVRDPGGRGFFASAPRRTVRADSRGAFKAPGLEPGRYNVEAAHSGYLTSRAPNVAAAATSPGSVAIALTPAASISGKVVDEKKQPVRGARVRLAQDPSLRRMMRRGGGIREFLGGGRSVMTGPDGTYRLDSLAAENGVSVEAAKSGLVTARKTGVTIKAGQKLAGVDLVLKAGLSARGRIVDSKTQPVSGAEIRVSRREGRGGGGFGRGALQILGGRDAAPDAVSGADGSFAISGLEEGDYEIRVSRSGFAAKTSQLAAASPGPTPWPPIVLAGGAGLAGFVKTSGGTPVVGATIAAIGEGGRPDAVTSGPDGSFRIADLAAGKAMMLIVNADGYAPARASATPPAQNVAIVLQTTATIKGRVEDASSGDPITEFTVSLSAGRGGGFGGFGGRGGAGPGAGGASRNVRSADGSFELDGVSPGSWSVHASAAGYRAADVSGIEVDPGQTKEDVVVSLKRGGSLAGKVIDSASGVPVANVMVTWEPQGQGPGPAAMAARLMGQGSANVTATDADGKFAFDGLPEGKVTLTATHPDYLEASRDADPDSGNEVQIPLGTGGTITGTVVASDGKSGAPSASVRLDAEGDSGGPFGSQSASADGSGNFEFDHLGAGRFRLSAQSDRGTSAPKEVLLADGQRQDGVILTLSGGAQIDGSVTGLPPEQLGGIRIRASASGYSDTTQTDDGGKFTLQNVPSGVVTFTATTAVLTGRTTSKTVEIADGTGELPVEIAFVGQSSLSGRITRGSAPMPGLFVLAMPDPPDGSGRHNTQTDSDGHYELDGMNDGDYQVSVNGGGVSYRKEFTVEGDTNGDIELPGTTITGRVTDSSSGDAVEGASVDAETGQETQSASVKRGTTDSNGVYSLSDVDPGSYQVTARKTGYKLKTQGVTVGSDQAQLDFALDPGNGVPIRVVDGLSGMPLGGVNALAFSGTGTVAFQGVVSLDSTGSGEIPSLVPGRYAIFVFSAGYAPRSFPQVDAPPPAPIDVVMTPGGSVQARAPEVVSGRILDSGGNPYLLGGFRLDGVLSVAPPVTVWQHLAPGAYAFVASSASGSAVSYPFTVIEGQTTQLQIK
ncbi:MAG TPA: carboxypeptidase regulatory-like domain-containing protein [Thermoanaerobaculia bacterium]